LFDEIQKLKHAEFRMQAALQGVDLSKEDKKQESTPKQPSLVFGDPTAYDNLSDKDKQELTNKMLRKHKAWAKGSTVGEN